MKQRNHAIRKSAGKELNLGTRTIVSKKIYNRKKKYQVSYGIIKLGNCCVMSIYRHFYDIIRVLSKFFSQLTNK